MKKPLRILHLLHIIFLLSSTCKTASGQQIRAGYDLYNRARVCEAQGDLDSAARLMLHSIKLNNQDIYVREYAWAVWFKTGRYDEWLSDMKAYYQENSMPETVEEVFRPYDSAEIAKAKADIRVKKFVSNYTVLKRANKLAASQGIELKLLLETCLARDQFVRNFVDWKSVTPELRSMLLRTADSFNLSEIVKYIRKKPLPALAEGDGATNSTAFFILTLHILGDSMFMAHCPGWHFLDSTYRDYALAGKLSPKGYTWILDRRHRHLCNASDLKETQLFRTVRAPSWDAEAGKLTRSFRPEIKDVEHIDEMRAVWYQPTLLQERIIDSTLVLPPDYNPKGN